ncbi:hypothetical protein NM74_07820 [Aeromonas hydrophila]|uniref:phage tail fiber protein n=1 Tax=Aeromonas hydrophila TaxID=644 RepID=UPI00053847DE|nr:hypothetical protein [Aeromonas hydrophila]KHA57124.1 hypothetical protein NM74_07820 [Aeromonas hydrophila]
MSAFTDYLEDKLLRATLCGEPYTPPTKLYIALFTSPTYDLTGSGDEVLGNGYARIRVTFAVPAQDVDGDYQCVNDTDLRSPSPSTAAWGTITHFAIHDALTGGNRLYHGPLTTPRTIDVNDLFFIQTGDLKVKLS